MKTTTREHAVLSKDSYKNYQVDEVDPSKNRHLIDNVNYEVIATTRGHLTGYQGTAYRNKTTSKVIIAHRGTETSMKGVALDALVDLGMIVTGHNAQLDEARAFTNLVLNKAKEKEGPLFDRANITVTGHSLGGALAEATAYEFGLRGETFNGYGAVDLQHGIPEGGDQVINHVRVTDVVSAASRHFGSVRYYATDSDIQRLTDAGYHDHATATSLRNPFTPISFAAHTITHFAPDAPDAALSDLSEANEQNARDHARAIGLFRADIHALRGNTVSSLWEAAHKAQTLHGMVGKVTSDLWKGDVDGAMHTVETIRQRGGMVLGQTQATVTQTMGLSASLAEHAYQRTTDTIGHSLDTAHRAMLHTVSAIGHRVEHAADTVAKSASEGAQYLGREVSQGVDVAQQAAQRTTHVVAEQVDRGVEATVHGAQYVGREIAHGVEVTRDAIQRTADVAVQQADRTVEKTWNDARHLGHELGKGIDVAQHAVQRGAQHLGREVTQGIDMAQQGVHRAAHAVAERVDHGLDATIHGAQYVGREVTQGIDRAQQGVHRMTQSVMDHRHGDAPDIGERREQDHSSAPTATAPESFIDRMYAAFESGNEWAIQESLQEAVNSQVGRDLRASIQAQVAADELARMQEQIIREQAMELQKQMDMQMQMRQRGPVLSR